MPAIFNEAKYLSNTDAENNGTKTVQAIVSVKAIFRFLLSRVTEIVLRPYYPALFCHFLQSE